VNIVYSKFFNATDRLITTNVHANAITTEGNELIGQIYVSNLIVDPYNLFSFTIETTHYTIEDAKTCMYRDDLNDTTALTTEPPEPTSESPGPTGTTNGWTIAVAMAGIIATTTSSIIKHKKRVY